MAVRRVIEIDEEKCSGCGLCVSACHEGAIGLVDGKARLLRDDYCDGLGDCLPACPEDAISFVEREAAAYDEAAVLANKAAMSGAVSGAGSAAGGASVSSAGVSSATGDSADAQPCGCPGAAVREFQHDVNADDLSGSAAAGAGEVGNSADVAPAQNARGFLPVRVPNEISTWPIQIKLVPTNMPAFDGCNLLIAADCCAFAYGNFHHDFMKDHVCLIGCPKLDGVDYSEKLAQIISGNNIASITLCRMEVPCCGGLEDAACRALSASGKDVPLNVVTFSLDGHIL